MTNQIASKISTKKNCGFGKIIILGEHLVGQGLPALVASLDLYTYAEICENNQPVLEIVDNRPKAPGFVSSKKIEYMQMLKNILDVPEIKQHIKHHNFLVTLSGSLPVTCGGIGSSSAVAVAFARAVSDKFNLNLSDEQINRAAFIGEAAVHGTPSGIDNTAATFGGAIKFCKNDSKQFSKIKLKNSIEMVIVDSGKQTDTKRVISCVHEFVQKYSELTRDIFSRYELIFNLGVMSFESGDLHTLGFCMTKNHYLLRELEISCSDLDFIVHAAIEQGALGAKLTGTGRGGLVIALTPGLCLQSRVANFFENLGYFVIKTKINA